MGVSLHILLRKTRILVNVRTTWSSSFSLHQGSTSQRLLATGDTVRGLGRSRTGYPTSDSATVGAGRGLAVSGTAHGLVPCSDDHVENAAEILPIIPAFGASPPETKALGHLDGSGRFEAGPSAKVHTAMSAGPSSSLLDERPVRAVPDRKRG